MRKKVGIVYFTEEYHTVTLTYSKRKGGKPRWSGNRCEGREGGAKIRPSSVSWVMWTMIKNNDKRSTWLEFSNGHLMVHNYYQACCTEISPDMIRGSVYKCMNSAQWIVYNVIRWPNVLSKRKQNAFCISDLLHDWVRSEPALLSGRWFKG